MRRRDFLKTGLAAGAAYTMAGAAAEQGDDPMTQSTAIRTISQVQEPLALTMWDFSWLLRHHPAGEFADWDVALDELVERGYNAIRADVFPHLIAARSDGSIQREFYFAKNDWKPALWGNKFSIHVQPREALVSFLQKCRERDIHVGFSSWFSGPGVEHFNELDGFVRAWTETLEFIEEHELLDTCLYVDLLNEYPLFHGYGWLTNKLNALNEDGEQAETNDDSQAHIWREDTGSYSREAWEYYRWFGTEAIRRLRQRWPQLEYMLCQTYSNQAIWQSMDFSEYDVLDVHYWFNFSGKLVNDTDYWEHIHTFGENDQEFPHVYQKLRDNWDANKDELIEWMDENVAGVAAKARELGVPCGSTEGWGLVCWMDHPYLPWDIIQEAAEIGAALGHKHGYAYNCSSNFCHPTFPGHWRDVAWHKHVTNIIKKGA